MTDYALVSLNAALGAALGLVLAAGALLIAAHRSKKPLPEVPFLPLVASLGMLALLVSAVEFLSPGSVSVTVAGASLLASSALGVLYFGAVATRLLPGGFLVGAASFIVAAVVVSLIATAVGAQSLQSYPSRATSSPVPTPHVAATVEKIPGAIAVSADTLRNHAFVLSNTADQLFVVDGTSAQVLKQLQLPSGSAPVSIAIDEQRARAFITGGPNASSVSQIDASTLAVLNPIPVGPGQIAVAVDPSSGRLFLAQSDPKIGDVVVAFDPPNYVEARRTSLPSKPTTLLPSGGLLYVALARQSVLALQTNTLQRETEFSTARSVLGIAASKDTGRVYFAAPAEINQPGAVLTFDRGLKGSITGDLNPARLAIDSSKGALYVTNPQFQTVTRLDLRTEKVAWSFPVGASPNDVAVNPVTQRLFITSFEANRLVLIDLR